MSVTIADGVVLTAEIGFSTTAGSGTVPINSTLSSITYTDVSDYVRSVQIKRGRSSELDSFTTGSCQVLLDNRTRIFDPEQIPYVYLPGVSGNYVSTPDAAVLDVTGDIDIAVRVAMDDWTPSVIVYFLSKGWTTTNLAYSFYSTNGTGRLVFYYTENGTTAKSSTSTVAPAFTNGQAGWVRATMDVDDGAGNRVAKFYTAPDSFDYPTEWTQLGATRTTAGTTSIFAGTNEIRLGMRGDGLSRLAGKFYRAIVKNGIDGTAVADFDATKFATSASTTCVAETGETWTLNKSGSGTVLVAGPYVAGLTPGRPIRIQATPPGGSAETIFQGYVDQWDQQYTNPSDAVAVVTASDAFKVMNLITLPSYWEYSVREDSALAWYRMDEVAGSTSIFDTISGANVGSWYTTALGASSSLSTSSIVPTDSNLAAQFDGDRYVSAPGFSISRAYNAGFSMAVSGWIQTSTTTDGRYGIFSAASFIAETRTAFGMVVSGGVGTIQAQIGDNLSFNSCTIISSAVTVNDGKPHFIYARRTNSGTATRLWVDGVEATSSTTTTADTDSNPKDIVGGPFTGTSGGTYDFTSNFNGTIDELVFDGSDLTDAQIVDRYAMGNGTYLTGQISSARITSLLTMAGWMSDGTDLTTATSTVQGIDTQGKTLLSALKECEDADQGRLFIDGSGKVAFISHNALATTAAYNTSQRTFGDSTSELPFTDIEFIYNDQLVKNRVVSSRQNGPTFTTNDTTSQGQYFIRTDSQSGLINDTDQAIVDAANVRLALYKQPSMRIESLGFTPRADTTIYTGLIGDELGTRITVNRRPQSVGAVISKELLIEGVQHDIAPMMWSSTYNLSPAPLDFFILDSSMFGVLNTNLLGY